MMVTLCRIRLGKLSSHVQLGIMRVWMVRRQFSTSLNASNPGALQDHNHATKAPSMTAPRPEITPDRTIAFDAQPLELPLSELEEPETIVGVAKLVLLVDVDDPVADPVPLQPDRNDP